MKTLPQVFLCLLFLNLSNLSGQSSSGFSVELATSLTYTDFLLNSNKYEAYWDQSGIKTKVKSQLGYHLEARVLHRLGERLHLKLGIGIQRGHFRYQMEGLITETAILNNFDNPQTSTLKADFQFWNLEVPVLLEYSLSSKYGLLLNVGVGGRKTMPGSNIAFIEQEDGMIETLDTPVYLAKKGNLFGLLGLGKEIPINSLPNKLKIYLQIKYSFLEEGISFFEYTGHLFNSNLQIAYRF